MNEELPTNESPPPVPRAAAVECPEKPWKHGTAAKVHGIPVQEKMVHVIYSADWQGHKEGETAEIPWSMLQEARMHRIPLRILRREDLR